MQCNPQQRIFRSRPGGEDEQHGELEDGSWFRGRTASSVVEVHVFVAVEVEQDLRVP